MYKGLCFLELLQELVTENYYIPNPNHIHFDYPMDTEFFTLLNLQFS